MYINKKKAVKLSLVLLIIPVSFCFLFFIVFSAEQCEKEELPFYGRIILSVSLSVLTFMFAFMLACVSPVFIFAVKIVLSIIKEWLTDPENKPFFYLED